MLSIATLRGIAGGRRVEVRAEPYGDGKYHDKFEVRLGAKAQLPDDGRRQWNYLTLEDRKTLVRALD